MTAEAYVGRFAPSPTGPLHFGSLIAALGSYLDARAAGGKWLVRIDDIDPPREVAGSSDAILRALGTHGLRWDDNVLYQSSRREAYSDAVNLLLGNGKAFRCRCTRKMVAAMPGGVYDGRCRLASVVGSEDHAVRSLTDDDPIVIADRVQGAFEQNVRREIGDFVIKRRDGLFAYQLAATVDDAFQTVTDVVRGSDLLDSTPRQAILRRALGLPELRHAHLPVVVDPAGLKLSKQHGAAALSLRQPSLNLHDALRVLRQGPPGELRQAPVTEQLAWAKDHWEIKKLKNIFAVRLDDERSVLNESSQRIAVQHPDD